MSRVLVLGATGRFGYAAAEAFRDAGWEVTSLVRSGRSDFAPRRTRIVEAVEHPDIIEAARGADVVVHALNPLITEWERLSMSLTYVAIEAAEKAGATLLVPGNVYNYGATMPETLDETTPQRPTMRKGLIRKLMEQRIREATERGMRALILRAGDFYGGGRGSWFDLVVVKDMAANRITYPGPFDVVHEWAYLPDLAKAAVLLAEQREKFAAFEEFGFPGHAMTGNQLVVAIETATKRKFNVRRMSWWMIKTFGQMLAIGRELGEIEYLWRIPHRIDGSKLKAAIGEVPRTPMAAAVAAALDDLKSR